MFSRVLVGSISATAHSQDSQVLSPFHFSSLCCDVNIWRCWCSVYGLAAQQAAARDLIMSDHDSKARNNCILVKAWTNAKKNCEFLCLQELAGSGAARKFFTSRLGTAWFAWRGYFCVREQSIFGLKNAVSTTMSGRSKVSTIFGFMPNPFLASVLHHACGMQKPLGAGAVETTGDDFEPNHYKSLGYLDAVFVFCRCLIIIYYHIYPCAPLVVVEVSKLGGCWHFFNLRTLETLIPFQLHQQS